MKNLIEPEKLEYLKSKPMSYDEIEVFLDNNKEVAAGYLCKVIGVSEANFYSWRSKKFKREAKNAALPIDNSNEVIPTGVGKRKYSTEDKLKISKEYSNLKDAEKAPYLRRYGIYSSDIARWTEIIDKAAFEALNSRKPKKGIKTPEQLKIEELQQELQIQEKVISKLSTIIVFQKKVSAILKDHESI